jgi:APA family basic amino acid/polyamine antiporter
MDPPPGALHWLAAGIALFVSAVVAIGLRASARVNLVLVACSLAGLVAFIWSAAPAALGSFAGNLSDFHGTLAATSPLYAALQSIALMFVAFTGHARVATLGEEVHEPRTTIPRAIIATLWISAGLYLLVAVAAVGALGGGDFAALLDGTAAPLETASRLLGHPMLARVVAVGALAAMLGVLLNLTLGLSRVLFAMGRRGDMPAGLGAVGADGRPPLLAVLLPGLAIAAFAAFSDIKAAWSFSAFSVLVYYSITNLAALKLQGRDRLFPRAIPACGLMACLGLSVFLDWRVVLSALALLLVGLVWHWLRRRSLANAT